MKQLSVCLLLALLSFGVCAQCNTTLEKLIPETSVNNDDRFGSALAANGQYLVVAAENSDTLGILYGGAAYVYEKTAGGWAYRAMLKPSDPNEYGFFGTDIDIDASGKTIVVIDRSYPHNRIYVFEKPASGWETMTETVKMQSPDYSDFNTSVNVSGDATKIVVGHPWSKESKFVVFYKPETGWNADVVPQIFSSAFFGTSISLFAYDIVLQGDYIYVSCSGDGLAIYVYKLNGTEYQYLAKLSVTAPTYSVGHFGEHLTATEDMVACTGAVFNPDGDSGMKIFLFRKDGEWTHATETAQFEIPGTDSPINWHFPLEFISPTELAASTVLRGDDWSVGKVFVVKQTEGTWANISTQVIFQENGLHLRSGFALKMIWNGSELVRSVGSLPVGLTARDAVVSLTRNGGIWGSLQHVSLSRYNSASFYFGNAVHKTGTTLFAGAPYDGTSGKGAGAVYVYEKSGDTFQKVHTIVPGRRNVRPTGGVDAGFGYSITSFGDELAIGAPSYLYGPEMYGKIFLYRRTGSSWSSATLYDSLSPPPELMLNHVGATVVMNEHVLFATAYNNRYASHSNAIVVYERVNGKWTYMDVIIAGRPFDKSWPSLKLSLHGDKLLAGSYYSLEGGTFIFEKNYATGKWLNTALFSGGVYSSYGNDVKLLENHFFVGVPAYPWKGVVNSGAVMVYAKLPGQQWNHDMTPVATIGPEVPIEGGNFGSSIDVIGNTLVVGAPGSFLTQNSQVRTIPGNTYIIQSEDYYWQHTTEFLNLQGERHGFSERDYFGFDVGVDEENFYIGSRNENTEVGSFSGAVYYIQTPPLIFLLPPVCQNDVSVQLYAYPFDGTWSGPGIEDASGKFNPALAGQGISHLVYETPNCAFQGKVQIDVQREPVVSLISPEQTVICFEEEVMLAVTESASAKYDWYFKPAGSDAFGYIGTNGAEKDVSNPGQYFARVFNKFCSKESPILTVSIESVEVVIGPQAVVCNHNLVVPLQVSINTGLWEGTGISNNEFHSGNLENGKYSLTYRFTTPLGCNIALKDTIELKVIEPLSLQNIPGDFCETGTSTIQVSAADPSLDFKWYYNESSPIDLQLIDKQMTDVATVHKQGYYSATATYGPCSAYSDAIHIGFNRDLAFELTPSENSVIEVCQEDRYVMQINSRQGTNFSWYFKPLDAETYDLLKIGIEAETIVDEAGEYKVIGEYGFCSFETKPVSIFFKQDSLFLPNVFTPNGDEFNETFKMQTNIAAHELLVFNRYGEQLYVSADGSWDGGNSPSGIYYWHVNYIGCNKKNIQRKGWVHLIR